MFWSFLNSGVKIFFVFCFGSLRLPPTSPLMLHFFSVASLTKDMKNRKSNDMRGQEKVTLSMMWCVGVRACGVCMDPMNGGLDG